MSNNASRSDNASESARSRFVEDTPPKQEDTAPVNESPEEGFDYVIPAKRKKHKKHHHDKSSAPKALDLMDEDMDDFVFVNPTKKKHHKHGKHRKKWPLWLKIIVIVVSVILAIAIAATATYFIMKEIGRNAMHDYNDIDITIPLKEKDGKDSADVMDKGRTIKYGGKTYRLNEDIMTVTFIGFNEEESGENNQYMADAIYITAIDDHTGKTTILGISRDTMLDVDVYSVEGKLIDTEKKQLSYAYSYGNEKVKGGQNVNTSLSRLFFGLPLKNYFAIDLSSLKELNDAIGGVTLVSKMTFESKEYGRTIEEGEEVTLMGKDAVTYVQARDINVLESNNTRMDRQQQYIMAFLSSIVPAAKKDLSVVTNLYGVLSENADSSLDLPKLTYLASTALGKLRKASDIEYVRLTGKIKAGEHAEMYVKDKDALETMLKVFYTPV